MNILLVASIAIALYILATARLGFRFSASAQQISGGIDLKMLLPGCLALLFHAIVLYQLINTSSGLNMGFYNALSLVSWVIALLVLLSTLIKPTENLAMIIFPATAVTLLLEYLFPSTRIVVENGSFGLDLHIIFSIAAYSLLSIAALQAVILAFQEHQLRAKHPVSVMRRLPPMQTMEELLVQLLWVGFFLLSLGLASGMMFIHNLFGQNLSHKTVLSILAWLFFGLVLFGRTIWGWRGKYLVRFTLSGFALLMLAYFGPKFVYELILQRV